MTPSVRTALLAASAALLVWLAALAWAPWSVAVLSAAGVVCCLLALLWCTTGAARAVWFNLAFAMAAVGVFDAYLAARPINGEKVQTFSHAGDLFVVDDDLGVRPRPGLRTTAAMRVGSEPSYDVVYTFDEVGLRVSPPEPQPGPDTDCVLFFGGSFTFGEGVEDEQTMPYRVGVRSGGRYRVRNFGFSGYGPHQMLAAIQSGLVDRAATGCHPRYAIYQAVYHHVLRAAGIWSWDRHGPRFVVGDDGRARRAGNFDTDEPDLAKSVANALGDSGLGRQIRRRGMDVGTSEATEADVQLFRSIVATAAEELEQRWPGIEFHVLYWDRWDSQGPYDLFDESLQSKGITVHNISEILPDRSDWERAYRLPHDIHPNATTHDLMAAYVVRDLLGQPD